MRRPRVSVVRRGLAASALAVGTLGLVACGDDGGRFDDQVAEVRTAIDAGDHAGAEAALENLAVAALGAHQAGELSDDEVAEIASLIESSRALLGEVVPPATTTTASTTTAPPTTTPPPDASPDGPADGPPEEGPPPGRGNGDEKPDKDKDNDDEDDD